MANSKLLKAPISILAAFAVLLWAIPVSQATTIAAVVTPENIVIAADSLVTKQSAKGFEGTGYAQKIETIGSTVVAAGGLIKTGNNLFNVFNLASQACRQASGAESQAQLFATLMRMKLPAVVSGIREQNPKNGAGLPLKVHSTVWFCGVEGQRPVIYEVKSEIGLGLNFQSRVSVDRFPPYTSPQGSGVVYMGPDSLGARPIELNPMRLRDLSYLVESADEIVRAGISDPQGRSGGAVTIFHISRQGPQVISRSSGRG